MKRGGYAILGLAGKHPAITKNYANLYPNKPAFLSLFVYLNESSALLSVPRYFQDPKDKKFKLSKKANVYKFGQFEKISKDNSSEIDEKLKNFYLRAKTFAYLVAKELNEYDKADLDNAFKQFEEKHGKGTEISYTF